MNPIFFRSPAELPEPYRRLMQEHEAVWSFFQAQPPSYRKAAGWWIVSAKKEETRLKRLKTLTELSAQGLRLPQLTPGKPSR